MVPLTDLDAFYLDRQREMLEPKRIHKLLNTISVTDNSNRRASVTALAKGLFRAALLPYRIGSVAAKKLAEVFKATRPLTP